MNLSYLIKKNKKGNYIHFKIKADGKIISELYGLYFAKKFLINGQIGFKKNKK